MPRHVKTAVPALLLAFAVAGGARAEATATSPFSSQALRPMIVSSQALAATSLRIGRADALETAVVPKRAVDRRLASSDLVGSLGFLCGLQPRPYETGSVAAYGSDPHGRFVGAKLSYAFR